jgi:hypothetical protein
MRIESARVYRFASKRSGSCGVCVVGFGQSGRPTRFPDLIAVLADLVDCIADLVDCITDLVDCITRHLL